MAAKKKSTSKASKKVAGTRSAAKTGGKKKAAKKKTAKKKAAKTPSGKSAGKKASGKKAAVKAAAAPAGKADTAGKSGASSMDVNLGQVFALRPRVETSFRPVDFAAARHQLQAETFDSPQAAARAVAEKALELTHGGPPRTGGKGRRW